MNLFPFGSCFSNRQEASQPPSPAFLWYGWITTSFLPFIPLVPKSLKGSLVISDHSQSLNHNTSSIPISSFGTSRHYPPSLSPKQLTFNIMSFIIACMTHSFPDDVVHCNETLDLKLILALSSLFFSAVNTIRSADIEILWQVLTNVFKTYVKTECQQ